MPPGQPGDAGRTDPPGVSDGDTEQLPPVRTESYPVYDDLPQMSAEELSGLYSESVPAPLGRKVQALDDEPSAMVSRYLFPTEKFRGEWRKHWIYLSRVTAIFLLATIALGWLTGFVARYDQSGFTTIIVLVWLAVLAWAIWRYADWYHDRFILTNKRIMAISGLVKRKVGMMPLLRVTDMKYEQSPTGRMLGYGTFVLESAGQDQALREVRFLPNPNELYLRIVEEMYEPEAVEARLTQQAEDLDDA
jgi:membrane protein YdbS with pleckstrin-like domain